MSSWSRGGPLLSLALAALGYAALLATHLVGLPGLLVQQLVWANLLVGVFNLLPGLPLDGGRMLRAGVWKASGRPGTATVAAAWAGRVLAVAVLVVPIALLVAAGDKVQIIDVVWFGVIAAFMWTGAGQSLKVTRVRERLPGLQARTLARRAIPIPASLPLAEAIRRADAAGARALVVVDHEDKPIAIVNESAVMATPPQRRPWVDAGSLARTIDPGMVLPADLSGMALLEAVRRSPATEYLLVEPSGQVRASCPPATSTMPSPACSAPPATVAGVIRQRRGPFAPGDQVQLTDPKGRKHLVLLAEGRTFHTHRGGLAHDDLIGAPEGSVVKSSGGTPYVALRPLLADFTLSMARGAAVVYPKDAAQIIALADIFPGARVLEAGAGSGALSCWLLRSVGEDGLLVSYERRQDFADIARDNVERFFGGPHPAWQLRAGDLMDVAADLDAPLGLRIVSTGWYWTCWRHGSSQAWQPRYSFPAGCCAATSRPSPSCPGRWSRSGSSPASTSLPPGSRWSAAGTLTGWRCGRTTGWWATPDFSSRPGGSPRESPRHREGAGPRRVPGKSPISENVSGRRREVTPGPRIGRV